MRARTVLLPEPDGPTTAVVPPGSSTKFDVVEHRGVAVTETHAVEFDARRGVRVRQRLGSRIQHGGVEHTADAVKRCAGRLDRGCQLAQRGERLQVAGDDDDQRDRLGHSQLAAHREHSCDARQQDQRKLAGEAEQQLPRDLHTEQSHARAVLRCQGTADQAAGRFDAARGPQCLLRAGEFDEAFGESAVGLVCDGVGLAGEPARSPHGTQQHHDAGQRREPERHRHRKQRNRDGGRQQDRADERSQQVDHEAHQFRAGRGDRLSRVGGVRTVRTGQPVEPDVGQAVGDVVLRVVQQRETQVETEP